MNPWRDSPNIVQRGIRRLIGAPASARVLAGTFHHVDRAVSRISGGRTTAAAVFTGLPIITLTTTGAKSGQPRSVPLVGIPDGERLILIASNWGQARHPAWYHNVKANPTVTVSGRVDGPPGRLHMARELAGEERAEAWARVVKLYPWYAGYAARAGREIPVVVLENT